MASAPASAAMRQEGARGEKEQAVQQQAEPVQAKAEKSQEAVQQQAGPVQAETEQQQDVQPFDFLSGFCPTFGPGL